MHAGMDIKQILKFILMSTSDQNKSRELEIPSIVRSPYENKGRYKRPPKRRR